LLDFRRILCARGAEEKEGQGRKLEERNGRIEGRDRGREKNKGREEEGVYSCFGGLSEVCVGSDP